jgi:hypothetical protein
VLTPDDGLGYFEAIDGKLPSPFQVEIAGCELNSQDVVEWHGTVKMAGHKYDGLAVRMTPRLTVPSPIVILHVRQGDRDVFGGAAEISYPPQ